MLPHPLTKFEIQKYHQNEPRIMVFIPKIIYKKQIKTFISNENIKNIFRIKAYNSIICGYFCIDLLILWLHERL